MKRFIIALALVCAVVTGAAAAPKPEIPGSAQLVQSRPVMCMPEMLYVSAYDSNGDGDPDFMVYGYYDRHGEPGQRFGPPRLFLFFDGPGGDVGTVFLKMNGAFEKLTLPQLEERFPSPCDLVPVFMRKTTNVINI
jgi:hypothetical protein